MAARQAVVCNEGLNRAAQAQAGGRVLGITHMAIGLGKYTPDGSETALRQEIARKGIAYKQYRGNSQWAVSAEFTEADIALPANAAQLFFEVGFIAQDAVIGDDVLLYVISDPVKAVSAISEAGTTTVTITIALAAMPDGSVTIEVTDPGPIAQDVLNDLSHRHAPGEDFKTVAMQTIERWEAISAETHEQMAQMLRQTGQSGVIGVRQYLNGGDAPHHRTGVVNGAAFGVHNHPNYRRMCGFPELEVAINGYGWHMRHMDYRWYEAAPGSYAAMVEPGDPAVPPSVLALSDVAAATEEMRQYLLAYHRADTGLRNYKPYFDLHLSYIECWYETLTSEQVVDFGPSFRHHDDQIYLQDLINDAVSQMASGVTNRFENTSYVPRVIKSVQSDGTVVFSVLRYRIATKRMGTLADWPLHRMLALRDDPRIRIRDGQTEEAMAATGKARYRVLHAYDDETEAKRQSLGLIDQLMARVYGLQGGGTLDVYHVQTNDNGTVANQYENVLGGSTRQNGAVYSRFYSYAATGAAGLQDYRRGFNDGGTFTAFTTHPEVTPLPGMGGHLRCSWALPLELIVAPPTFAWNPHGIAVTTGAITGNGSSGNPYSAAKAEAFWYLTPAELFTGDTLGDDPANTGGHVWMRDQGGTARLCAATGAYVLMPAMPDGTRLRTRFPIAPAHWEGHPVMGELTARQAETDEALLRLLEIASRHETTLAKEQTQ